MKQHRTDLTDAARSRVGHSSSGDVEFFATLFGCIAVLGLVASLALIAAGGWIWFASFISGQAAGWAQLVGGLAAIGAAYRMGASQIRADRELELLRTRNQDVRCVLAVDALFEDAQYQIDELWRQAIDPRLPFFAMTEFHADRIADCITRISAIDPFALPFRELIRAVTIAPQQLNYVYSSLVKYQNLLNSTEGAKWTDVDGEGTTLSNSISLAKLTVDDVRNKCVEAMKKLDTLREG